VNSGEQPMLLLKNGLRGLTSSRANPEVATDVDDVMSTPWLMPYHAHGKE
jgi:hypothetical protein